MHAVLGCEIVGLATNKFNPKALKQDFGDVDWGLGLGTMLYSGLLALGSGWSIHEKKAHCPRPGS